MNRADQLTSKSVSLINAMIAGDVTGVRELYGGTPDIDDPFAGHQVERGFETMVEMWRPTQNASVSALEIAHATEADGFIATELDVTMRRDGRRTKLAFVAVSEIGSDGRFARTRLYYRRAHIDGHQHFRDRILHEEIHAELHPTIRKYQDALQVRDFDAFIECFADDGYFDGHGGPRQPTDGLVDLSLGQGMGAYRGKAELNRGIGQMMRIGAAESPKRRLEHVNAFSDGTTTVVEFNILKPEENRVHAGVACYELDEAGLLRAARVYDEAW